jgi:hypothetical protein
MVFRGRRSRKAKAKKDNARGFVLPGYKYLGPFNGMNKGPPTNPSDEAAYEHDKGYAKQIAANRNPYIEWNVADEEFLKRVKDEPDYGGKIASSLFNLKRRAAKNWGILSDTTKKSKVDDSSSEYFTAPAVTMGDVSMGDGSSNGGPLKETPVDEVVNVSRGPPEYTFASLPYMEDYVLQAANGLYLGQMWAYRMTSPYDPTIEMNNVDQNAGAGTAIVSEVATTDAADNVVSKTRWWDMYVSMYDYYHVISCKWRITFENLSNNPLWLHHLYANDESPPILANNHDIRCWKNTKSYYIGTSANAIVNVGVERNDLPGTGPINEDDIVNNPVNYENGNHVTSRGPNPIRIIEGQYSPGDYKHEIRLDDQVENWTEVTKNPKLAERLYIMLKPSVDGYQASGANSSGGVFNYRMNVEIEYLVEFKQLKTQLRWPVNRQPLTITLRSNTVSTD